MNGKLEKQNKLNSSVFNKCSDNQQICLIYQIMYLFYILIGNMLWNGHHNFCYKHMVVLCGPSNPVSYPWYMRRFWINCAHSQHQITNFELLMVHKLTGTKINTIKKKIIT